jgi:hypothetical protein
MQAGHLRSRISRPRHSPRGGKSPAQEAIARLLEADFRKAGFEFGKFGPLIEQGKAENRQREARFVAEAKKQSPAVLEDLHRSLANLNARIADLRSSGFQNVSTEHVFLDTATEIVTSGIAPPVHTRAAPQANVANFNFKAGPTSGTHSDFGFYHDFANVSFGFVWQNLRDTHALLTVDGFIVLNGYFGAKTEGGFFVFSNFSQIFGSVGLSIHELWNQPPTSPFGQPVEYQAFDVESEISLTLAAAGEINSETLYRGFDIQYTQFLVPPKGTALFEVYCAINTNISDGEAQADFVDPFQVLCPGVLITATYPPPSSDPTP